MMRHALAIVLCVSVLLPYAAAAQGNTTGSTRPRVSNDYLQLRTQRACADTEHTRMLANQLRMRLPETMVVTGDVDTTGQNIVEWVEMPDGCAVVFRSGDERAAAMTLPKNAELEQIELAASRVAFLVSVADDASDGSSSPLGVPGKELDDDELERAPTEKEQTEPPPTPPEPDELDDSEEEEEPEEVAEDNIETSQNDEEATPDEPEPERPNYAEPRAQFFLLPGLSLPTTRPPGPAPRMALGALGTYSAGANGMAVAPIFNIQTDFAKGVQAAGIFNRAGDLEGVQTAGIFNSASTLSGTQAAGVFNYAGGGRLGLQFAGVLNIHTGSYDGVQVAGVVNVARSVGGIQLGLATNVADDVSGVQIGLVNVGSKIDGTQVGLVNVADESDFSFGLINVIWSERFWWSAETSSDGYTLASLKHGSRYLKWSLWAGTSLVADTPVLLAGLGLGVYVPLDRFHLAFDVIGLDVSGPSAPLTNAGILEARLSGGWSFYEYLAAYAGVGYRSFFSDGDDFGLVPGFASDLQGDPSNSPALAGWPHAFIGVRF